MTSMFVFIFGKYNETQDLEVDYNDKNQPLNNSVFKNMPINIKVKLKI